MEIAVQYLVKLTVHIIFARIVATKKSKIYTLIRALRTDLHSAVLLGGEDGNKAGNKEHLKRLYNICH